MEPTSEPTSDLLPLYAPSRGFDTVMRGYDKPQVDREIGRLDDDVRITTAERDAAAARSADLAAQLASAQAQIESLRRQLRAASEAITADNVDGHVKQILQAAKAEAAKIRADAQAEAEQLRVGGTDSATRARAAAQAEAERILAAATERMAAAEDTYKRRIAEAEQHRADIESSLAQSAERTRAEEERLSAEAGAERDRLDRESAERREALEKEVRERCARAGEDFEITLRSRRSVAYAEEQAQRKAAEEQAAQLIADATTEMRQLHAMRDDTHAQLTALHDRLGSALSEARTATPDEPRPRPAPQ
jgi:cell division septum initiation protein DivIVA